MTDRFKNSRRMAWFALGGAIMLQGWAIAEMGSDANIVLASSIPAMLALVWGWTKATNDAEAKLPKLPQ